MTTLYPLLILIVAIAFVAITIVWLRIHPFIGLIVAAAVVGVMTSIPFPDGSSGAVAALELTAIEFGRTAGNIGIVIVLASIIGKCLMDSGAADMITRRFLRWLGIERAPLALLGSGYVMSIPVFFDTVFYLLVPLAKAFHIRTGGSYAFYVLSICAGAVLTHSLVAPTPGPLIMATNLDLDLGTTIIAGIAFSVLPAVLVGFYFSRWLSKRVEIPLRESPEMPIADLTAQVEKPDSELPSFWLSILPIILPVLMITCSTVLGAVDESLRDAGSAGIDQALLTSADLIGNRNLAMFASALVALFVLVRQSGQKLGDLMHSMEPAIAAAGIIILITSAGGAFGAMIRHSGIATVVSNQVDPSGAGSILLIIAFGVAAIMKIAQGSSTVALITASAIMFPIIDGIALPFHPVYIFLAIGFGAMVFSWMNDSGFWVVGRMSGFTEMETLKTWTVMFALMGLVGFLQVLIVANLLPLHFLP